MNPVTEVETMTATNALTEWHNRNWGAVANPSGINPTEYKVLVEPAAVEEKTKGGIIKPDMSRDQEKFAQTKGRIIAVSPLAFSYATEEEWLKCGGEKPKVGDMVLFGKYAGFDYMGDNGVNYRIIMDKDICATVKE